MRIPIRHGAPWHRLVNGAHRPIAAIGSAELLVSVEDRDMLREVLVR